MKSDIYVYVIRNGEPMLDCIVTPKQLERALRNGLVVRDTTYNVWRLTPAGEAVLA